MTPPEKPETETGAALISVLVLVGVMAAIAVGTFDRLRLATSITANAGAREQAQSLGLVAETLVTTRIDDLVAASPGRTTLAGGWLGRTITLPLPQATAQARVRDGGNCFNLNSLVTGIPPNNLMSRPLAIEQFGKLMRALEIPPAAARRIAASAADWIDSDELLNPDGAEDAVYATAPLPYRTANTLMAEASELRAVNGVTPAYYARLRPYVCALPETELSAINVNTLAPEEAPLLAMLFDEAQGPQMAARVLAERPPGGWSDVAAFWNTPTLRDRRPASDVFRQPRVRTVWFRLDMAIDTGREPMRQTGLIDVRQGKARVIARRWTEDE
jgi:general secretion pathway protein K